MSNLKLVRGRAMRATRLDGCGEPVLGPDSVIASEGFISIALTSNSEAGEAITVTNAAGKPFISDTPTPKFINYSVVINFAGVNPALVTLLTGQPVVLDAEGEIVGFRQNSKVDVDLIGFCLEFWTGVAVAQCEDTGDAQYGYGLLPFIKGGVLGDFTVENAAISFSVTGAATRDGSGWGVGPFDVVLDDNGVESPLLEAITDGDHLHMQLTSVAPPDVTDDGFQALGVPATGAVASTGATTPSNSYAPLNLTELQAGAAGDHGEDVVASPTTAWTTGQNFRLRDGSTAHWTSSAWAAGPA